MGSWPIHLTLVVLFREDDGSAVEREITIKAVQCDSAGNPVGLSAHCGLSGCFREFANERIEDCHDPATGQPVPDLPALLRQHYAGSRAGRMEALQHQLGEELNVLLRLGRADGLFQQREKTLIATYLCDRQRQLEPVGAFTVQELAPQLVWLARPSQQAFEAAVESLAAAEPSRLQQLYATCVAVADVKESRDGSEQPALDHLQARWFNVATA